MTGSSAAPSDALIDWVHANGRSIDDDAALLEAIGQAPVLAIGEPGHAAREPLAFRNRVVDLLLAHDRIGAVALESGILEARAIDDFVRGGSGDAVALARDHLSWGFGRLSENVALLRRLRVHNHARADDAQVRFFGFDISGGGELGEISGAAIATTTVSDWLRRRLDPHSAALANELDAFGTCLTRGRVRDLDDSARSAVRVLLDRIDADLLRHAATSSEAGAWAGVGARLTRVTFEMFCRWPDMPPGATTLPPEAIVPMLDASGWRDAAMADNVDWLRRLVPGRRIVLFAANGHVIADRHRGGLWVDNSDRGLPAGHHLRMRLGADYRVVLTASASSIAGPSDTGTVGSIDRLLATAGRDRFLIELDHAPDHAWLDQVQSIGTNGPYLQAFVPRRASDAWVHFAHLTAHPPAQASAPMIDVPQTEAEPVHDTCFDIDVADPYRWLEADVHDDARVRTWIDAQVSYTERHLASLDGRDEMRARLESTWSFEKFGCPVRRGARLFYTWNSGLLDHDLVVMQEDLAAVPGPVIDPQTMHTGRDDVVRDWQPSRDGTHIAYTVQPHGGDWRSLHVIAVDGTVRLDDALHGMKAAQFAWHPDGDAIFYTRFEVAESSDSPTLRSAVRLHRLGEPQSADRVVFDGRTESPLHLPQVSDDGSWLVVSSLNAGGTRAEVRVQDLSRPDVPLRALVDRAADRWVFLGGHAGELVFLTDRDAPFGRVVALDPTAGVDQRPRTIVPEGVHAIRAATLAGDEIVVQTLDGTTSTLRRFTRDGQPVGDVPLPPFAVVDQLGGHVDRAELFFRMSSMVRVPAIHRVDLKTGAVAVFREPAMSWNPEDHVVRQITAIAPDGTRVPVTIAHARDRDPRVPQPTILMAYGGFGISPDLSFWESRFGWIRSGGVFAIAHVRGGAEYGSAWAEAGRKAGRLRVIEDYLAAADALVAADIAASDTLVALGASNGGLLVAAATNARPDRFAVTLCRVPVTDLLRYTRFTFGRLWVDELGDPDIEADFRTLLAYSPLHNVRSGERYPAMLVTTSDADDRVVPSHSFKYVATLQAAAIGPGPHLIRIEKDAGHGEGKSARRTIDEFADLWTFALAHVARARCHIM